MPTRTVMPRVIRSRVELLRFLAVPCKRRAWKELLS